MKYFLSSDDSGHQYAIPVKDSEEWEYWLDLPSDDPMSWDAPDFAIPVEGTLTFENPLTC